MTEHFTVRYDGPALADHTIPVTALAPALLSLSELFNVAHGIASTDATLPPALEVRANREGSFAVDLVLVANETVDLFSLREVVAAATAFTLLEPVVKALRYLQLSRRLGSEPETQELEPGQLRITWPDGTTFDGPSSTRDLAESMDFRRTAKQTLAPLEAGIGIDTLEIRSDDADVELETLVLDREDAHDFDKLPSDDQVMSDVTREVGLNPLKPSFESGYKWWVSDGTSRFWVTMHDLAFLQRVETSAEAFAAGDVLRCKLRSRQLRDDKGELRMEHTVLEVLDHLRMPPPDPLPGV